MPAVPVRVLLADDHPMLRAGIRGLLDPEPDIVCVGEAADGVRALRMALAEAPDILVLDMSMPFLDGVAVARRLREAGSQCRIVAMTAHEEAVWLDQLLELGMRGYVLKRSAADDLLRAIRAVAVGGTWFDAVAVGGTWFDPAVAGLVVEAAERRAQRRRSSDGTGLSERESAVLRLTVQGHGNNAIALALHVGVRSVETYKTRAIFTLTAGYSTPTATIQALRRIRAGGVAEGARNGKDMEGPRAAWYRRPLMMTLPSSRVAGMRTGLAGARETNIPAAVGPCLMVNGRRYQSPGAANQPSRKLIQPLVITP